MVAHRNGIQAMVLANQLFDTTLVECESRAVLMLFV